MITVALWIAGAGMFALTLDHLTIAFVFFGVAGLLFRFFG